MVFYILYQKYRFKTKGYSKAKYLLNCLEKIADSVYNNFIEKNIDDNKYTVKL